MTTGTAALALNPCRCASCGHTPDISARLSILAGLPVRQTRCTAPSPVPGERIPTLIPSGAPSRATMTLLPSGS